MNRREFLVRATIGGVTMPLLVTQIGCDGDSSSPDGNGNGGNGGGMLCDDPNASFSAGSNVASGHTHDVTIECSDVDTPPGSAQTLTSTTENGHTHSITLDPADYMTLQQGGTVNKTSTAGGGHTHNWVIMVP